MEGKDTMAAKKMIPAKAKVKRITPKPITPYLVWGHTEKAEVHSLEELEQVIDRLTIQAKEDMPFSVQVSVDRATCLLITVGREESHMEFYSETQSPLGVACRGPWDSDELIGAKHGGQYSEIEKRYCVPIADAREALRRYFQTGTRPDNIRWGNDRWNDDIS